MAKFLKLTNILLDPDFFKKPTPKNIFLDINFGRRNLTHG